MRTNQYKIIVLLLIIATPKSDRIKNCVSVNVNNKIKVLSNAIASFSVGTEN